MRCDWGARRDNAKAGCPRVWANQEDKQARRQTKLTASGTTDEAATSAKANIQRARANKSPECRPEAKQGQDRCPVLGRPLPGTDMTAGPNQDASSVHWTNEMARLTTSTATTTTTSSLINKSAVPRKTGRGRAQKCACLKFVRPHIATFASGHSDGHRRGAHLSRLIGFWLVGGWPTAGRQLISRAFVATRLGGTNRARLADSRLGRDNSQLRALPASGSLEMPATVNKQTGHVWRYDTKVTGRALLFRPTKLLLLLSN